MRWVVVVTICLLCASARADDWGVRRNPFDPVVVGRYKAILARDPHDVALGRLLALYQRHRTVGQLDLEYRARLEGAQNDWATLVVLARMARANRPAAIALWDRALAANPADGRGWLALGEITLEPKAARTAFQHAVTHARSPAAKRAALVKLIGAARSANDPKTVDAAYADLIALAPKDGQLWLDRGSAQLAANQAALAIDSFIKAESLLARDPERRVTAMINRGVALERMGRIDDAIAQWVTTLDKAPRTSYLRREIVPRIIEAERKRGQLAAATELLEKRWPERARGHYEWDILGDLYRDRAADERALVAYQRAVAKAPTEVETQRKLIKLLDKLKPSRALAQHEAAARIAPGDANLQIDLAKRYRENEQDRDKAMATLDRLTKRVPKDVGVHLALIDLYAQWDERDRELAEREVVANLEPNEADHAVALGEAYWRAEHRAKAIAAWQRVGKIKSATTPLRLAEIFAMHSIWDQAAVAYTSAIELDGTKPEAWRGRARANAELGRNAAAVSDAKRGVALIGVAPDAEGSRTRFELVRALGRFDEKWQDSEELLRRRRASTPANEKLITALGRWRFAFQRGDIAAGYLLVAHHARIQSHQHHDTLVELYRRVPTDDGLGVALARSFSKRKEFVRARIELAVIAKRTPKRATYIAGLVEQVDADEKRGVEEVFREEEGRKPTSKDIVGEERRLGFRFGVGVDIAGTSSALLDFGIMRMWGIDDGAAFIARLDYTQRDDEGDQVNAFAPAFAVSKRLFATRRLEFAGAIGPRFEFRYGYGPMSAWNRVNVSADVALELLPRALPATLGVRLQQALTDDVRGTAVIVELGFEVR
ncbi:MAG: hypothetical protein H0V17_36535 [Deltaproteobacteria bacterium]|nr:hypothetical protein [Deltaproteobacteria bacterium]